MMKTYLVSVEPAMFQAVAEMIRQQQISIIQNLEAIAVLSVSCTSEQQASIAQIQGVLAVEEEGTSFAI